MPQLKVLRNEDGVVVSVSIVAQPKVQTITLTPESWKSIVQFSELSSLSLSHTDVTNADVVRLLPLKQLVSIDLSYTQVTGDVLTTLASMPALAMINLESCQVNDKHLERLNDLQRLLALRLAKTQVTDAGLKHIRSLKQLDHLDLSACEITDTGLQSIGHLPRIQLLWLSKTVRYGKDDKSDLTDACIDYLTTLKTLTDLQIADSRLSEDGLKRLQASLPNTKISLESNGVLYVDRQRPSRTKP